MSYATQRYRSPAGEMILVARDTGLCGIIWGNREETITKRFPGARAGETAVLREAARQLDEYFAGTRAAFALPLAPEGTEFQKKVWAALAKIPFGETRSYSEQAAAIAAPTAVRAVGAANGMNPLSIVLPCHRVIGSNGALTGYAGGLDAKRALLKLERGFGT